VSPKLIKRHCFPDWKCEGWKLLAAPTRRFGSKPSRQRTSPKPLTPSSGCHPVNLATLGPSDGKSGKSLSEPVPATKPKLSDQGLYLFSLFTYSPKYNNILPFYFHTGLVYRGLIPTRDNDQLMVAFGFAQYSFYNIEALQQKGNVNQPNYTAVLEVDCRIQINKWAFFQPYVQYIIQPNGTGAIEDAAILGFESGVIF
jgi:porin